MAQSFLAIIPIFMLIILGALLFRFRFVSTEFWTAAERLTYYVTFPALLIGGLARADLSSVDVVPVAAAAMLGTTASGLALIVCKSTLGHVLFPTLNGAQFSSLFQGTVRPNTYVGLGVAYAMFGEHGLVLTAVCLAAVVPMVNIYSICALLKWASHGSSGSLWGHTRRIALNIAKNPLILSCAIGITLNATGIGAIPILDDMMLILGRAALPIGLLAVGAGLMFSVSLKALQYIAIGATFKLMALPIFAFAFAVLFGLSHVETGVVVLYAALPCSASAYILARQMGGDAQMMAQVITLQTIASTLTIPAMLWLLLASA